MSEIHVQAGSHSLVGCNVTLSDMEAVLPLLRNNYERNLSPSALRGTFTASGHISTLAPLQYTSCTETAPFVPVASYLAHGSLLRAPQIITLLLLLMHMASIFHRVACGRINYGT